MNTHRPLLLMLACTLVLSLAACSKPAGTTDTSPASALPAPAVVAEATDIDVTTSVKTALLRDDATKAFDVAVVTTKGDVRLTGVMDTQMQIDRALTVTRAITGVHAVHDELTLKK